MVEGPVGLSGPAVGHGLAAAALSRPPALLHHTWFGWIGSIVRADCRHLLPLSRRRRSLQIDGRLCTPGPCQHSGRLVLPFVCSNSSANGRWRPTRPPHPCNAAA